jgi:chromosomal replication initiator protein
LTLARIISVPEIRAGLLAVERAAASLSEGRSRNAVTPIFLHGPTGTGKTLLVDWLARQVRLKAPELACVALLAGEWSQRNEQEQEELAGADLLIVEDLQYLPRHCSNSLATVVDSLVVRRVPVVVTANAGPRYLDLPTRLTSRLSAGLTGALEPLGAASRLRILEDRAQRKHLTVSREVLEWLANNLTGGGRQIDGAIQKLEDLAHMRTGPLDVACVAKVFETERYLAKPSMDLIACRVGDSFQVSARQLRSEKRSRRIVLPRQVGMFLARQLTRMSLEEIGGYFGGRDHSTVIHACRKVETAMTGNEALSGTVRQLRASLT